MSEASELALPFIAIRKDVAGDPYARTMGEYLCNPLDEELLEVEVSTGGFFSDDDGVIESAERREPPFVVPARGAYRFALSTEDEYDEFVLHWTVRYRTATGGSAVRTFGCGKRLGDAVRYDDVVGMAGAGDVIAGTQP